MTELTKAQRDLKEYVERFYAQAREQEGPTVRQVGSAMGISSAVAHRRIQRLIATGYLKKADTGFVPNRAA